MVVRELITRWLFDTDTTDLEKLDSAVENAMKKSKQFGRTLDSVAKSTANFAKGATTFVSVPLAGIGAAMAKVAIDAEETESKFNTVFQTVSEESKKSAKNLVDNYGLSSTEAQQLLGDTGDLLSGFGFGGDLSLGLSEEVQKLAVDLASFTNFSGGAQGASEALTKALLGERESVKALGIAILEEDVKAKVKALEAAGRFTNETERQRKAIATLALAQEQSKNAIGDFARTQDSTANKIRLLQRDITELALEFGKILIPSVRDLVGAFSGVVNTLREMSPENKEFLVTLAKYAILIPPVVFGIAKMVSILLALGRGVTVLKGLAAAFKLVGTQAILTQLKILAIPLLIIAGIAAVVLVIEDFYTFLNGGESVIGDIVNKWKQPFQEFVEDLTNWIDHLIKKWNDFFDISDTILKVVNFVNGEGVTPRTGRRNSSRSNAGVSLAAPTGRTGRRRGGGTINVEARVTNNLPADATREQMNAVNKVTKDGLSNAVDDVLIHADEALGGKQ